MTATDTSRSSEQRRWAIDLRPLRVPAYRRLWLGNGIAMFGFQFTAVAVPVEMYALTEDSLWVGLLGIAGFVPLLIFGLWGGAVADAADRRRVLLGSSVLLWISVLGLLAQALLNVGSPVLLLALVALSAVSFALGGPARGALVGRLVPTELVPAAATLNFTTAMATSVLGPLAAGLILATFDLDIALPIAYGLDATLLVALVWAAIRLPVMPPEPDPDGTPRQAGLRSIVDGVRYLAGAPVLLLSFAIDLIAMVFAFPRALFPEVATERFGGGAAVGWLYASIALGSLLAGLFSGWIGRVRRQGLVLVLAVVGWGVAVALAGLARQLWLVVALLVLAGAADLVSSVVRQSMLIVYAPDRMRGRLQGVNTVVVAGGPRLGDLRAGAMAAGFGSGVAWVGGGLAAAALAVLLAVAFPVLTRYRAATGSPPADDVAQGRPQRAETGSGG
ncbi:MFS transporter [Micromonospora endophytica]|uniref:MFS transporter n=1 Tax=Micromonospora endophytica TaxID=515350 RepID=A0A2W2D7K0_9ACTN|nr:MFS transporter [Micromonospora endophytica]PZF93076.1 MFS transporter [Micromonospora endophytica]RIW45675.1 MFS transporter [Micromonospora endophytica]BCJ58896.1 MFS transporter [Micromonospora endophytica]